MNFLQIPRVNSLLLVDVCTNYELNQSLIEVNKYLVFSHANPASILDCLQLEPRAHRDHAVEGVQGGSLWGTKS